MTCIKSKLLQFRMLITVTFLTLFYSNAYSQITKFDDDLFLITREYAEFVAARFDSLEAFKKSYQFAISELDSCVMFLDKSETIILKQNQHADLLSAQIITQSEIIKSYQITDEINKDLQKRLKKETRKRKAWKVTAVAAIIFSGTAVLWIAIH